MRPIAVRIYRLFTFLILIPSFVTNTANARLVEDNSRATNEYKVGILATKAANGDIKPLCEFAALDHAPTNLRVASGPSRLPSLPIPTCNDQQLKVVAQTVNLASSNQTAALMAFVPAVMCVTLAASVAVMKAKDLPLNNTASFLLGANAMALTSSLGMGMTGLGGATLCTMAGEGTGEALQFLIAYFTEPS